MKRYDPVISAIKELLQYATPYNEMPQPYDDDRYYSDNEKLRLRADMELRLATQALIDLLS